MKRQRHQQVAGDSGQRQRPFSPMDTTQVGREARRARRQQALSEGGQRRFEQGDLFREGNVRFRWILLRAIVCEEIGKKTVVPIFVEASEVIFPDSKWKNRRSLSLCIII